MLRSIKIAIILIILFSSNADAGLGSSLYSSRYGRETGTVVAAVQIKDKGLYNLVISAQFLRRPQDTKVFKSDEYNQLIDRLMVEWHGVALQKVLKSNELTISSK